MQPRRKGLEHKWWKMEGTQQAPKGRDMKAQGIALGPRNVGPGQGIEKKPKPQRGEIDVRNVVSIAPLQGFRLVAHLIPGRCPGLCYCAPSGLSGWNSGTEVCKHYRGLISVAEGVSMGWLGELEL